MYMCIQSGLRAAWTIYELSYIQEHFTAIWSNKYKDWKVQQNPKADSKQYFRSTRASTASNHDLVSDSVLPGNWTKRLNIPVWCSLGMQHYKSWVMIVILFRTVSQPWVVLQEWQYNKGNLYWSIGVWNITIISASIITFFARRLCFR